MNRDVQITRNKHYIIPSLFWDEKCRKGCKTGYLWCFSVWLLSEDQNRWREQKQSILNRLSMCPGQLRSCGGKHWSTPWDSSRRSSRRSNTRLAPACAERSAGHLPLRTLPCPEIKWLVPPNIRLCIKILFISRNPCKILSLQISKEQCSIKVTLLCTLNTHQPDLNTWNDYTWRIFSMNKFHNVIIYQSSYFKNLSE